MTNVREKFIRLDQYLYFIRLFKSRSLATKFVLNGKVKVGQIIVKKPHKSIFINDTLIIDNDKNLRIIKILKLPSRRGPYSEAKTFYEDHILDKGKKPNYSKNNDLFISRIGRPTKMDRRKIDKLMGRN